MKIDLTSGQKIVCDRCNGNGWIDSFSGGFTRSDLDEQFCGDYDAEFEFIEDYKRGAYGDTCPVCKGSKITEIFLCDECGEERVPMESDFHSSDTNICGYCIPYEPDGY